MFLGTLTPGGVEDAIEVDISLVPSRDPLAFAYGFKQGLTGLVLAEFGARRDLARAFVLGHELGLDVRDEKKPMPNWARRIDHA